MSAPNIITNDRTIVCPEHYAALRQGCNWRKLQSTYERCSVCRQEKKQHQIRCHGPGFCNEIDCHYCNSL